MSEKLPLLTRMVQAISKATSRTRRNREGSWRGPFSGVGELGSWFRMDRLSDGWQRNLKRAGFSAAKVPIVYGCVMAQARAVSSCYAQHRRVNSAGKHEIMKDTIQAKLLRKPNGYETWPQFILNVVAAMLFEGECGVMVQTTSDGVPVAFHRLTRDSWQVYIDPETSAIFYGVSKSGNPCVPEALNWMIPAREFIHFRQHTPRHPLMGESPVTAAALSIGVNVALSESQMAFFENMRRPSGVLSTDIVLTSAQIKQLREAFDEQAADMDKGGIPILGGGLKFSQMAISSQDSEVIQTQRMTNEDVCRVYGVPPPIVCDLTHATLNNAETLINHWLSIGLGSILENVERSFDAYFDFGPDDYIELDVAALLRADFVQRVEGYVKGLTGGLYTHNEARNEEGLPPVEDGDQPYIQQQMVPLSYAASQKAVPPPTPPASTANPDDEPPPDDQENDDGEDKNFDPMIAKALLFERINTMRKAA